ncbi:macro domain-containing protein [Agaribacterium haliotis]|uniref:macro domain-containing protein n=1 Tax=Agaribacterium haliotis TaxID=2013869 RepID=UPI000BB570E3|nr:macro domain-containing protein [Agaribacterium haliotis]
MSNVQLILGDISAAGCDAIVNAANPTLLGGGGVDGAIHRAAGPALYEACLAVPPLGKQRCPTGEARITAAGKLNCRYVIHTVGPVYHSDEHSAPLLKRAYENSLLLALANDCRSLALPAISCGAYAYPLTKAAAIALGLALEPRWSQLDLRFYLYEQQSFDSWQQVFKRLT